VNLARCERAQGGDCRAGPASSKRAAALPSTRMTGISAELHFGLSSPESTRALLPQPDPQVRNAAVDGSCGSSRRTLSLGSAGRRCALCELARGRFAGLLPKKRQAPLHDADDAGALLKPGIYSSAATLAALSKECAVRNHAPKSVRPRTRRSVLCCRREPSNSCHPNRSKVSHRI